MDAVASALHGQAERLWHVMEQVTRAVSGVKDAQWSGAAADAFVARLRGVADGAKTASAQHAEAAHAARLWSQDLSYTQELAGAALRDAEEALEQLASAKALLADVAGASLRVAQAQQQRAEAEAKARRAAEDHAEAEAQFAGVLRSTLSGAMPQVPVGQLEDFAGTFRDTGFVIPASAPKKPRTADSTALVKEVSLQYRTCRTKAEWAAWAKKNKRTAADVIAALKKLTPHGRERFNTMLSGGGARRGFASWLLEGARSRKDVAWLHDHLPNLEPGIPDGTFWKQWDDIDVSGPFGGWDINQGGVNDCWWLATLAGYANTQKGQRWLKEHIRDNGNGTFTVTLYKDGEPFPVTVTDYFPAQKNEGVEYPYGARHGKDPNWVSIYEKARAAMPDTGSYDVVNGLFSVLNKDFGSGGAMETLTGDRARWFPPNSTQGRDYSTQKLRDDLEAGRPITVTTAWPGRGDLLDWHVYTVTAVDPGGIITLRNPWGPTNEKPEYVDLTLDELKTAGWYFNVGAPK